MQGQIQSLSAFFFLSSIIIVCISDLTLQSLLNGLMCYKPDDPIEYLESCLQKVKELGGAEKVKWDTFVSPEKKTLPPLNGGQSRRSFFRNGNVLSMKIFIFSVMNGFTSTIELFYTHIYSRPSLILIFLRQRIKFSFHLGFHIWVSPPVTNVM